jgi:hypothetical protein
MFTISTPAQLAQMGNRERNWRVSILSSIFEQAFVPPSAICPFILKMHSEMQVGLNTLRTGSFKFFKRPFLGFLTILTL